MNDSQLKYDFDQVISRAGTHSEKYDARQRFFGDPDVEPFWVADMDLPTPKFLVDAMQQRLMHPMFGYTEQYDEIFASIIWWMKNEHQAEVVKEWITLSPSVVTTISLAIQAFTQPGESIAILSPVYGPFFFCAERNNRVVEDIPLQIQEGLSQVDFDALEASLSKPKVKMLILCNPQNPGGRVWLREELEQVVALCTKYHVILFSDEIHCDIVYEPHQHCSVLTIPNALGHCVVAHSIGKTFNTSGLQASFAMIPDEQLRKSFQKKQAESHVEDINLLGKIALKNALSSEGSAYKKQLNEYLRENTLHVVNLLNQINKVEAMIPQSTFLVWADFRSLGKWQHTMQRLIKDARVAISGGRFFGPAGEGWFRVNCGHPREKLYPAVERIVGTFSAS